MEFGYGAPPWPRATEDDDIARDRNSLAPGPLGVLLAFGSTLTCTSAEPETRARRAHAAHAPHASHASSASALETPAVERSTDDSAAGWTVLEASPDTRKLYVSSSSGNDANDGLSTGRPKRTIAAARELLRHGKPDWLLLRRGDVFEESLGQWKKSGRSERERMVVTGYGDEPARPLLRTGDRSALWTNGGGATPPRIEHVAFVGLSFVAHEYRGKGDCAGVQWLQPSTDVLFEDCLVQAYSTNFVVQGVGGRHADVRLRRSIVVDAYSIHGSGNHPQGLYAYGVDGLLVEENVFDHNGWSESVPDAGADIYSHNLYIDNGNSGVVVRGNIIANASSHGMQLRCGGVAEENLFVRNSIALSVGGGNHPEIDGVTAKVRGNVILDGKDIDEKNPRGWGLWLSNIRSGRVEGNVVASNKDGQQPLLLVLDGDHIGDDRASVGVQKLAIERNVFWNWGGGIRVEGTAQQIREVTLARNDIQDSVTDAALVEFVDPSSVASVHSSQNRWFSRRAPKGAWVRVARESRALPDGDREARVDYPHAERCASFFADALGTEGTCRAFIAEARAQSKARWRPRFTAASVNRYVKEGLDLPTKQ